MHDSCAGAPLIIRSYLITQMELGGKDVCIVCEDADLDLAAKNIVKGGFSYSGQRCTAVKVVLALDSIADELVAKVKKGVDALSVGRPEVSRCTCSSAELVSSAFLCCCLLLELSMSHGRFCGGKKVKGTGEGLSGLPGLTYDCCSCSSILAPSRS